MRNLIAAVLLALVVAPSVPWDRLPNIIPSPAPQPAPMPAPIAPGSSWPTIVPDAKHRAALSTFFADFATLLERDTAGVIANAEQLRRANEAASRLLAESGALAPNPALSAELKRRQEQALGLDPVALDAAHKAKAVAFYRTLATEFAQ